MGHDYVPWRSVKRWMCLHCGNCCRNFIVNLTLGEAYYLSRVYGIPIIQKDGRFYLPARPDGSCVFLYKRGDLYYCSIYFERPKVCRLYPLHISRFDEGRGAGADYINGEKYYVYIDRACKGVGVGPSILNLIKVGFKIWKGDKAS
ncbi:MAG: YkgJ family cysteine cluster protein [Candidatus Nezhaarchaeales archaeon]